MSAQTADTTDKPAVASFTYRGESFNTIRKPSAFLLAKLSRTDTDDPSAMGVIVEFFKRTLSEEDFRRFERTALEDEDEIEDGFLALGEALQDVVAKSFERPTK